MAPLSGEWDSRDCPGEDTPVGRLLGALELRACRFRRSGAGWQAQCPAHDDRAPSLSVRERLDGTVLVHCFAGCETHEVLRALGLTFSDLFPSSRGGKRGGRARRSPR